MFNKIKKKKIQIVKNTGSMFRTYVCNIRMYKCYRIFKISNEIILFNLFVHGFNCFRRLMFLFICFLHNHTTRNGLEGNIIHEIELGTIQLTFTTRTSVRKQ